MFMTIVRHCHITLDNAAEFGLEEKGAAFLVITEQAFNIGPDNVGDGVAAHDDIKYLHGNGDIGPRKHDIVVLQPFIVFRAGIYAVDVICKAVFARVTRKRVRHFV